MCVDATKWGSIVCVCLVIDKSLLFEVMPWVNRRASDHSFKPSLLKQSKPLTAYQPLIDSPSSPCHPANPAYWHSLTGTWGRTWWWTCPTWIRVGARNRGCGLFVCVCFRPPHSPIWILQCCVCVCVCAKSMTRGEKWDLKLEWLIPVVLMPRSLILFWFALLSIRSFYFQNGHIQYSIRTVNCVWGPLWGRSKFSVGQATCMNYEPPQPFTQSRPPPSFFTSFPRSISSTISPGRRKRIWSMVAPSPNALSRASGGSNGMSE